MIIARAPFRISFFGGGTDFPEYFAEHGGATLLTSIDKYCYLSVHRLSPFFKHRFRASYAQTESVMEPSEFKHPLIRESLTYLRIRDGMEIAHVSDLPGRTGLGTSSSFTVGLLHALHEFRGDVVNAEELAREAIIVERERIGDSGGHQDQYAAAYGGFIRINFNTNGHVEVYPVQFTPERRAALQARLMMFFIGTEMSAEHILQEQSKRTSRNLSVLAEMHAMVDTAQNILQSDSDLDPWGRLLHESWMRKKSLASGISNTTVDQAYEAARQAGAIGGKVLGAGGRGFLLFYAEPECAPAIRESLKDLMEVPFRFADEGSRIIYRSPE
jgi:D-glycero-alpha-D-manno-heptose-7-phosphate kinase